MPISFVLFLLNMKSLFHGCVFSVFKILFCDEHPSSLFRQHENSKTMLKKKCETDDSQKDTPKKKFWFVAFLSLCLFYGSFVSRRTMSYSITTTTQTIILKTQTKNKNSNLRNLRVKYWTSTVITLFQFYFWWIFLRNQVWPICLTKIVSVLLIIINRFFVTKKFNLRSLFLFPNNEQ